MRSRSFVFGLGITVVIGCRTNRSGPSVSDPVSDGYSRVPVKENAPVVSESVSESTLPPETRPMTPPASPVAEAAPDSAPAGPINPASTVSGTTSWFGSEMRTKNGFGSMGKALKVSWQVKPARGNCVITLLSLFNGDRIFSTNNGSWSEITFEIFGGAKGSSSDFQTQYITRGSPNDQATTRGKDHSRHHTRGTDLANIFDDRSHNFQIEWTPSSNESSSLIFRLDGKEIRRESGGDLAKLEDNLDIYTSVWISKWPGEPSAWGCSNDEVARPDAAFAVMESFKVEQLNGGSWQTIESRSFDKADDIWSGFDHSDWGFESFAGKYCPQNAVWQNGSEVRLDLTHVCGPGR